MEQKLTLRVGDDGLDRWLAARRPAEIVRRQKLEDSRHTRHTNSDAERSKDVDGERRQPSGDFL